MLLCVFEQSGLVLALQRWLNEVDIVWYESKGNLNWVEILKTIRDDLQEFVKDGGFDMFLSDTKPKTTDDAEYSDASETTDEDDEDYEVIQNVLQIVSYQEEQLSSESCSNEDSESVVNDDEGGGSSGSEEELSVRYIMLVNNFFFQGTEGSEETDESSEEESLTWEELEKKAIQGQKSIYKVQILYFFIVDDRKRSRQGAFETDSIRKKSKQATKA